MRYVVLNENFDTVENIVLANMALEDNWVEVADHLPICIGDKYDNFMFYSPEGDPRLPYETEFTKSMIEKLKEDNVLKTAQIQALSDRNDFLEDCIAEMAGLVYI